MKKPNLGTDYDSFSDSEMTLEDELFGQMASADRDYTEERGHSEIRDWDNMLECEVQHFNHKHGTAFDPAEMRYQYIERQEKKCGYY